MLLLTRKVGERVFIYVNDTLIIMQIVDKQGNHIKLGFQAPSYVNIKREELIGKGEQSA